MKTLVRKRSVAAVLGSALLGGALAAPMRSAAADAGPPAPSPGVVDGEAAHRLVASGVKVVDVRTPAEFAAGHVPGAVNIPHDQMAQRYAELGAPSTPLLVYCHSGRRSAIAGKVLREKGYTQIYDLQAYDRWVQAERSRR